MYVIGIIGGIGSGKSTVASAFERLGAALVRADELGHEVLRYPDVKQKMKLRFGAEIFDPDGEINRSKVAKIIFEPSEVGKDAKAFLEQLVHPYIKVLILEQFEKLEDAGEDMVVLDAPLLLEGNWEKLCDAILFVDAPDDIRIERVRARGWTEKELARREATQIPIEKKRDIATMIVRNDDTEDACFRRIRNVYNDILGVYD